MLDRLKVMRESIPPKIEQRTIRLPDELPGWDDACRFGVDNWRRLAPSLHTDGVHVLVWRVTDPDRDHGTLLWGEAARAVIQRYQRPECS